MEYCHVDSAKLLGTKIYYKNPYLKVHNEISLF